MHTRPARVGQFSDDGQWWWNGQTWLATSQLVLPQLPPTESELSGNLQKARRRLQNRGWLYWFNDAGCALAWLNFAFLSPTVPAWRTYRLWTFEQLALATYFLLGPDETILAAEVNLDTPNGVSDSFKRDLAVVVTARHVLIFRTDSFDGQPRWIVLAARPTDVEMVLRWVFEKSSAGQALVVASGTGRWVIRVFYGVSRPDDVIDAWRRAVQGTVKTG